MGMIMTTNCHSSCNSALKILVLACSIALASGLTWKSCKGYELREQGLNSGIVDAHVIPQKVCTGILDPVTKKITSLSTNCDQGAVCLVYQRWLKDSAAAKGKKQLSDKFKAAARKNSQLTKTLSMAEAMAELRAKLKARGENEFGQKIKKRRRLPQDSTDEFLKKITAEMAESDAKFEKKSKKIQAESKLAYEKAMEMIAVLRLNGGSDAATERLKEIAARKLPSVK